MRLIGGRRRRRRSAGPAVGRVPFNVREEVGKAWRFLWARKLEQRLKGQDFRGDTFYFSAQEVERRLRARAQEILEGKEEGALGESWMYYGAGCGVRITGLGGVPLLDHVRRHLRADPDLEMEGSRGGRCLSGARFRPVGGDQSPAEKRKAEEDARTSPEEKRRKAWIVHFRVEVERESGGTRKVAACQRNRKVSKFPSYRSRRGGTSLTEDLEAVTCKNCRKYLEKNPPPAGEEVKDES